MQICQEGALSFFTAVGIAAVVWLIAGGILHPRRKNTDDAVVLLPSRDAANALAECVHRLTQVRYDSAAFSDIVILDCGMDEAAQRAAEILCRENEDVVCIPSGQLVDYLNEREKERRIWESGRP